ncbi:hypothetical protein ZWY2020_024294 [Hordeum vulgare]|nr:hypothetical protein ZWY2020_024294 [Hordeum vulgare]
MIGGARSSDVPPKLEEQSAENKQIRTASEGEGEGRSIYFAVNILIGSNRAVASLYKVHYPYPCSPSPRRLQPVASMDASSGLNYVPVQTRSRRWIVAVSARHTTVFDTHTKELIVGPDLLSEKRSSVLVYVEDKIYALSSVPEIKGERDLEPWFEILDLSTARAVDGRLQGQN